MTSEHKSIATIAAINRDWALRQGDPRNTAALEAWGAREPALAGMRTLADFDLRGCAQRRQDAVLAALVRRAQDGPSPHLARTVLVHQFAGALVLMAVRTAHHFAGVDAAAAAALSALYEVLVAYPVADRPLLVAANIKLDTLKGLLRDGECGYGREGAGEQGEQGGHDGAACLDERIDALDAVLQAVRLRIVEPDDPAMDKWSRPAPQVDHRDRMLAVLVAAVRTTVLSRQAASLLSATYRENAASDRQLAAAHGCSQVALRQRRSRAIARLRAQRARLALVA